jgi:hypothetical protein
VRTNLACLPGVFLIELQHRKLERVHAGHVLVHPLTLERAVVQLMDDDGRHPEIPGRVATNAARDRRGRVVEQGDDGVHAEKIPHQRNTLIAFDGFRRAPRVDLVQPRVAAEDRRLDGTRLSARTTRPGCGFHSSCGLDAAEPAPLGIITGAS